MLQPVEEVERVSGAPAARARTLLAKRLADIVCLPTSRITPQERHLTGDLLLEMLRDGDADLRRRCASRIASLSGAPTLIVRFLARDEIEIARPILEDSEALSDSDLVATARAAGPEHRRLIAGRKVVSELVADALVSHGEPDVMQVLLRNDEASLSQAAIERMMEEAGDNARMTALLARRPELRPAQALALYWWSDFETRKTILRRFAVERHILQEAAADVFAVAAAEGWSDPLTRRALQFIERRQRNRAAIEKSPYDGLEDAVEKAARAGVDRGMVEEISYLCGVKPATGARILTDIGGEPIAVLAKAVGLKRDGLEALWRATRRIMGDKAMEEGWERVLETYDTLSSDKAQTVLRYWNWALGETAPQGASLREELTALAPQPLLGRDD